ncbi:MAG: AI-2E family transporter [Paracoccaceae bacterium]
MNRPIPPRLTAEGQIAELRKIKGLLIGLFVIAALGAIYFARVVLLPLVLALLIALTLRPVTRLLQRIGVPTSVSAVVLIFGIGGAMIAGGWLASGPAGNLVERGPAIFAEVQFKMRDIIGTVTAVAEATEQVEEITQGPAAAGDPEEGPQEVVIEQSGLLSDVVGSVASMGTTIVAAMILAMFLLASGDFFQRRIVEAAPRMQDKRAALQIVNDTERQISRYLASITIINAGLGLAIGLALWLLDMPNPFLWGAAAFLLNYLPFIGAIVGATMAGMVALVTFDSVGYALLVPAAYYLLTSLEGQIVTPLLLGRSLSLNTVAVFVTVMLWVWLWGIPGALLAVPVLVVIKVIADNVTGLKTFGAFLGNAPVKAGDDG